MAVLCVWSTNILSFNSAFYILNTPLVSVCLKFAQHIVSIKAVMIDSCTSLQIMSTQFNSHKSGVFCLAFLKHINL